MAYLVPAGVAIGGLVYALASWSDRPVWLAVRRVGWGVMVVPLLVPSTFTLLLPILAPLVLTLGKPTASSPVTAGRPA